MARVDFKKLSDEELAKDADQGRIGQGSVVESMSRLRESIIILTKTTAFYSKILIFLTIALIFISLNPFKFQIQINTLITKEKFSSLISLLVATIILVASFFQWWNITYNGKMITKKWVRALFVILIIALIFSIWLLVK